MPCAGMPLFVAHDASARLGAECAHRRQWFEKDAAGIGSKGHVGTVGT